MVRDGPRGFGAPPPPWKFLTRTLRQPMSLTPLAHGFDLSAEASHAAATDLPIGADAAASAQPILTRGRLLKLALAIGLLAAGALSFYQQLVIAASRDAVINARLSVIRAPIDGVVTAAPGVPGSLIGSGAVIGRVTDPHPDDARLFDLQQQAGSTARERENLIRHIFDLERARNQAQAQAEAYQAGRVSEGEARVAQARAALAAAAARETEAVESAARGALLAAHGFEAKATRDRLAHAEQAARADTLAARKQLDALEIDLAAAKAGTYLGDNYNDVPSSFQRARELALTIDETKAQLDQVAQKAAALDQAIAIERKRLAARSLGALTAAVAGRLWTVEAASGEYVRQGQNLFTVVDCATALVTASVSDSQYNSLQIGEPVSFRVAGTGRRYAGRIVKLGPFPDRGDLAIPTDPRGRQLAVAVPQLAADPEDGCAVGRTGSIRFEGSEQSETARLMRWLGGLFRLS
jgi:multidrug resistance efflux pump